MDWRGTDPFGAGRRTPVGIQHQKFWARELAVQDGRNDFSARLAWAWLLLRRAGRLATGKPARSDPAANRASPAKTW